MAASGIKSILSSVHVSHRVILGCRDVVSTWTGSAMIKCHGLVAESHVGHGVLVSVATTTATITEVICLFMLLFVLDLFAIWSVPNERKNRSNALNEQSMLCRLYIIQDNL
jgi:hypothetical protein